MYEDTGENNLCVHCKVLIRKDIPKKIGRTVTWVNWLIDPHILESTPET